MTSKFLSLLLLFLVVGCGASKKKSSAHNQRKVSVGPSEVMVGTPRELSKENSATPKASPSISRKVINTAMNFSGVKYKFGGTTRKGMDCSGLLYVSFGEHDIQLPRASYLMATEGENIDLNTVSAGDLLFFGTSGRKKKINHVGLVVSVNGDDIQFIHATTSRGVIVSSLREGYWNYAFIKATRIL